jgi:crotonobetainyl-CoA:carnitine CoA-transferase CaiB-like acyl-CoA transferase
MNNPPLAGLKVLDLTRALAGPYATMNLADLGAEIFKIEDPVTGDDTRGFSPVVGDQTSAYYLAVNRNKKSIAVDIKTPEGRDAVLAIAQQVDVVIENFRTGVASRRGLGYDDILKINPRVVYCSISGFGRSGDYAHLAGYDPVAQAESGMMSLNGETDGDPLRTSIPFVDMGAGLYACQAITAALYAREKTGEGQAVEVALYDVGISFLANFAMGYLLTNIVPSRVGNSNQIMHPVGLFQTSDKPFMLTVANENLYVKLCENVLNRPDLTTDPRFDIATKRVQNRVELTALLNEIFEQNGREHWIEKLEAEGIPVGRVRTVAGALDSDMTKERRMLLSTEHPTLGTIRNVASPMIFHGTVLDHPTTAPELGQDTATVLKELADYSATEIERLDQAGIINTGSGI